MCKCVYSSVRLEQDEQLAKFLSALKCCGDTTRQNLQPKDCYTLINTDTYGTQSTKYNCIADWNSSRKTFKDLLLSEYSR